MKKSNNEKIRLVLGVAVCVLFIALAFSSAIGEPINRNDVIEEKQESSNSPQKQANPILLLFYKIVNNDWDYWSISPNMYAIPPGNVGIGTTSPSQKLGVAGNIALEGIDASTSYGLDFRDTMGSEWQVQYYQDGLNFWEAGIGSKMFIEDGGNVGIGTTTPSGQLHVASSDLYSGYFTSDHLNSKTHVIHSEYTGSGNYGAIAVYGESTPADGIGIGGYFVGGRQGVCAEMYPTGSKSYLGVNGIVNGGSGSNTGVQGYSVGSGFKYGIKGYAVGSGYNYGLYGQASGDGNTKNFGVYGQAYGSGATNYAGYFQGNVHITGTLSKGSGSFKIDHPLDPENKYLHHSFVESPDMKNIYDGVVVLDAHGEAVVEIPDYFEALNKDFRYQLTAIGAPGPNLHIAEEISDNRFKIAGGEAGMKISWQVTGIRHDPYAEQNPIPVEQDKPEGERGTYLYPELYGMPETMGLNYREKDIEGLE